MSCNSFYTMQWNKSAKKRTAQELEIAIKFHFAGLMITELEDLNTIALLVPNQHDIILVFIPHNRSNSSSH